MRSIIVVPAATVAVGLAAALISYTAMEKNTWRPYGTEPPAAATASVAAADKDTPIITETPSRADSVNNTGNNTQSQNTSVTVKTQDGTAASSQSEGNKSPAGSTVLGENKTVRPAAGTRYATCKVIDASKNALIVDYEGMTYQIMRDEHTNVENPVRVGDTVRIYHEGGFENGTMATDISVVAPEISDSEIKYFTATVVGTSKNNIMVESEGRVYSVERDENTNSDENIMEGDSVRVYHRGDMADTIYATSIKKN